MKRSLSAFFIRPTRPTHIQSMHFWIIVSAFGGLGFFNGVWAVLIADLARELKLSPALLGAALSSFSCSGIILLLCGSMFADRLPRKMILLAGIAGLALLLLMISFIHQYALLLVALLFGGLCASCYDMAVNTIGGDYERLYTSKTMTLFHSGFNGGAALGGIISAILLASGLSFRTIYACTGGLFLLLALLVIWLPLPATAPISTTHAATDHAQQPADGVRALLFTPLVMLAIALVCLSFFTDGALEGYTSIYLRNLLGAGALLGGLGIAAFYLVGMLGRIISASALRRYGDRPVVAIAAMLSTLGLLIALSTTSAPLAVVGLVLVGLGQSPLVPTGFSLTAQLGPQRGPRAVALVTACGYSIFLIGPLLIGVLATLFSLRLALTLTIATSVCIVILARHLPTDHTTR